MLARATGHGPRATVTGHGPGGRVSADGAPVRLVRNLWASPPGVTEGPVVPTPAPAPRPTELSGSVPRRATQLIWRGMRSHPGTYVTAVTTAGLFGVLTVGVSRVLGTITDQVVVPAIAGDQDAQGKIWWAGAAIALVAVSLGITVALRRIFAGGASPLTREPPRTGGPRQSLHLPLSWHRQHPTGQ